MPSKVNITGGAFQDPEGNAVDGGTLRLRLSQDATISGAGQIRAGVISITLDASGNAPSTAIWGNDVLSPSGTTYSAQVFDVSGAPVWGPENWSLTGAGPIDLSTLVASSNGASYPAAEFASNKDTANGYAGLDASTKLKASEFPTPTSTTLGGVKSLAAVSHQFLTSIGTDGAPTQAQPAFSDISGTASSSQLPARVAAINYVIDGGGSVPATGAKGQISIPTACTITGWVITADQSGSAVVDVLRSTYANFPTTSSIASTDKPTLSTAQKNENLALSVWTTAISAGDIIQFNLNSVTTCTRLNVTLNVTIP